MKSAIDFEMIVLVLIDSRFKSRHLNLICTHDENSHLTTQKALFTRKYDIFAKYNKLNL